MAPKTKNLRQRTPSFEAEIRLEQPTTSSMGPRPREFRQGCLGLVVEHRKTPKFVVGLHVAAVILLWIIVAGVFYLKSDAPGCVYPAIVGSYAIMFAMVKDLIANL